jgi:hypothetical protein
MRIRARSHLPSLQRHSTTPTNKRGEKEKEKEKEERPANAVHVPENTEALSTAGRCGLAAD